MSGRQPTSGSRPRPLLRRLRRHRTLYAMALVPLLVLLVLRYGPVVGNVVAFRRYVPGGSVLGEEWVGLRYLELLVQDPAFWRVLGNTAALGGLTLLVCLPLPILVAILLAQLPGERVRTALAGVLYVPHVLSVVVVVGVVANLLTQRGLVNRVIEASGGDPVAFLSEPGWFRAVYVGSELWQVTGWAVVLHLAALALVDPAVEDAARLDGAGRWRIVVHVWLPRMAPVIAMLAVVGAGSFLNVGFEKVLLLSNPLTLSTADVVTTYVYRVGLVSQNVSYATAVGLVQTLVSILVLVVAHRLSRHLVGSGLW